MVGIGTDKVDLLSHQYKYSSLLGLDNQSWGYSYRGLAQHNARLKYYGKRYSLYCIVGVYLDLRRRYVEFYLNRRYRLIVCFLYGFETLLFNQTSRHCISSTSN